MILVKAKWFMHNEFARILSVTSIYDKYWLYIKLFFVLLRKCNFPSICRWTAYLPEQSFLVNLLISGFRFHTKHGKVGTHYFCLVPSSILKRMRWLLDASVNSTFSLHHILIGVWVTSFQPPICLVLIKVEAQICFSLANFMCM